jgi:hypothetical protein
MLSVSFGKKKSARNDDFREFMAHTRICHLFFYSTTAAKPRQKFHKIVNSYVMSYNNNFFFLRLFIYANNALPFYVLVDIVVIAHNFSQLVPPSCQYFGHSLYKMQNKLFSLFHTSCSFHRLCMCTYISLRKQSRHTIQPSEEKRNVYTTICQCCKKKNPIYRTC